MDRRSRTPSAARPAAVPPLRMGKRSSSAGPKRLPPPSSSSSTASEAASEPRPARLQSPRSEDSREDIRVVARVRPRLPHEGRASGGVEVDCGTNSLTLSNARGDCKRFAVDQVFDSRQEHGSQEAVFDRFGKGFVHHALSGYNVCVFAYGHTGSGKTFTMLGDTAGGQEGIMPRFLNELFAAHAKEPEQAPRRRYSCEFYEVYNEQIKDLLAPAKSGERTRKVHVHPKHGVRVENLNMSVVSSAEEALRLVELGNQLRAVAATTMNARSSRSHAIFTFKYEEESADGQSCQSTVTFVDLAGREDQSASQNQATQLREMCCINTSLFHLANVITKLSQGSVDGKSLADFRNSKLTLLLSPALIGNSKTALIATVAPLQSFFDDSLCTMNFASSVKKIRTRPVVNNKAANTLVVELEAEVRQLQSELAVSKCGEAEKERALLSARALISSFQRSWEEALAKSDELEIKRSKSLKSLGLADQDCLTPTDASGALAPFFTKLSDDPALQGHCNYFLRGEALRFGSDEQCGVVLQGVGIRPRMCEVRAAPCGGMEVALLDHDQESVPRVLVDGYPLLPSDGVRALGHGTCLFLGYAHAFRFVAPTRDMVFSTGSADACALARSTVDKLDIGSAVSEIVDESGEQFKDILPFISHLSSCLADSAVQSFLAALHRICPLVDEVNLITREVFGDDGLHFQVRALTDVFKFSEGFPEITVCLLQQRGPLAKFRSSVETVMHERRQSKQPDSPRENAAGAGAQSTGHLLGSARHPLAHAMGLGDHMVVGQSALLYVWSLEKFLWRLSAIREIYQEGSEAKDQFAAVREQLCTNPAQNPWGEVALEAVDTVSKCSTPCPISPRFPWDASAIDACQNRATYQASKCSTPSPISPRVVLAGRQSKTSDAQGKHADCADDSCSTASFSSPGELSALADLDPNVSREGDVSSDEAQEAGWMTALAPEVERLSAEVDHLRDMILRKQVEREMMCAVKDPTAGGAKGASRCSEDVSRWLLEVERLRETLCQAEELQRQERSEAAVHKFTTSVKESLAHAEEQQPAGSAQSPPTVSDAVLEHMQNFKTEVANAVRDELKDQLQSLQADLGSRESTACSSGMRSGQLTPTDQSEAAVVYVPKRHSFTAPVGDAATPPRFAASPPRGAPAARAGYGPTAGTARRPSPTWRRPASLVQRRRDAPSQVPRAAGTLAARTPAAGAGSPPLAGACGRRASPERRTPSTSPSRRRVVGPYPKLTWAYYEVLDTA